MKLKWFDKKAARVLCLILAALLLCLSSACIIVARYALYDHWYRLDTKDFSDTASCNAYAFEGISFVCNNLGWVDDSEMDSLGSYSGKAFSYVITEDSGHIIADTRKSNSIFVCGLDGFIDDVSVQIDGYVNLPVEIYEGCYQEYLIFELLFAYRYLIAMGAILLFLLAVTGLTLACASAVRAVKRGEFLRVTCIPGDLAAGLSVALALALMLLLRYLYVDMAYVLGSYTASSVLQLTMNFGIPLFCCLLWVTPLSYILSAHLANRSLCKTALLIRVGRRLKPELFIAWTFLATVGLEILILIGSQYSALGILILIAIEIIIFLPLILYAAEARIIRSGAEKLANGDLSHTIATEKLHTAWWSLGVILNRVGAGMSAAMEEQMKSERMKTELITNVSHDLKTPMTSIVSYVQLLKDETLLPEKRQEYLDILDRQSAKLKKLTEDVVEASKAASGVLTVHGEELNAGELLRQIVGEYAARLQAAELEPVIQVPDAPLLLFADSNLFGRILENLMTNILKYAQTGTRVYFNLESRDGAVIFTAKNISREPLNITAEELMERFVRGDSSRHSEGSGLGLSIAKSLTELMGGVFQIILDGDLFKAEIIFKQI